MIQEQNPQRSTQERLVLALKQANARLEELGREKTEPLALVGMGCRFPGGVDSPESFWQFLLRSEDIRQEVPADRWDVDRYYDPDPETAHKIYVRQGYFLDQPVDHFDPAFFAIAGAEAHKMDPSQRLMLEVVWEALEHSGIAPESLRNSATGVFIGQCFNDYQLLNCLSQPDYLLDFYQATGSGMSFTAGRIAYTLGLQGPTLTLDTVCSSSLVALHLAAQSLRSRETNLALVGGVNLMLHPSVTHLYCRGKALSPQGRCASFDAAADGFARGEGCGVVVLKRLTDAINDRDRIWALLRGSAVNHDGPSSGFTVPNVQAQQQVLQQALKNARLEPSQISYLECHATGTPLGDPLELSALARVYGQDRPATQPLILGSVKTNIGHLEAAAGIASVIKTALCLHHHQIPANLHFHTPNPRLDWDTLPLQIPTQTQSWLQTDQPRRAGVSSFGMSGTNAHVILEEAPQIQLQQEEGKGQTHEILTLSAKNAPALTALVRRYRDHLQTQPSPALADVCFTANTGRSHLAHRLAVVAHSIPDLVQQLDQVLAGNPTTRVPRGQVNPRGPQIAMVFPGAGSPCLGLGQLYQTQPTFRQAWDRCARILQIDLDPETAFTPPAHFALEYSLAQMWISWGIRPHAVAGEGVGNYVAACIAGVFSLEEGLRLISSHSDRGKSAVPQIPCLSAVTGQDISAEITTPEYWDQSPPPPAHWETLRDQGYEILLACGPNVGDLETGLPVPGSGENGWHSVLLSLAQIYVRGVQIDWSAFAKDLPQRQKVTLPTYPFQRQRYWINPPLPASVRPEPQPQPRHPSLTDLLYQLAWQPQSGPSASLQQPGHWLLLADQRGIAAALAQQLQAQGHTCKIIPLASLAARNGSSTGWIVNQDGLQTQIEAFFQAISGSTSQIGVVHLWGLETPTNEQLQKHPQVLFSSLKLATQSLLLLVQTLIQASVPAPTKLWLVTQQAQAVDGQDLNLTQSPLIGLGRTIAQEHPELWGGMIDLEVADPDPVQHLYQDLLSLEEEAQLAYRQGQRYVARLIRTNPPEFTSTSLSATATYLITGGLGSLGLQVAQHLADMGARYLVLLGRQGITREDQRQVISQLQAAGAVVTVIRADVSEWAELHQAFGEIQASLPPLRGILHTAGILDDALLNTQTWAQFARVMQPKVLGSWHLHQVSQSLDLDFFICFSSSASLLGSAGQGNYAAANAFMDALCQWRCYQGLPGLSLNWGPWAETGMTAQLSSGLRSRLSRLGIQPIAPGEGLQILQQHLGSQGQVGVIRFDWEGLSPRLSSGDRAFLAAVLPVESSEIIAQITPASPGQQSVTIQSQEHLQALLQDQVTRLLGLQFTETLDPQTDFFALGMDSLMALDLRNLLHKQLGVDLPISTLMAGVNIDTLVQEIQQRWQAGEQSHGVGSLQVQPGGSEAEDANRLALSLNQASLWFVWNLSPDSDAYNISFAGRLLNAANLQAWQGAFQQLISRHALLRSCFPSHEGQPYLQIQEASVLDFQIIDARPWSEEDLNREVNRTERQPFHLAQGPVMRVRCFQRQGDEILLLVCMHHIVCDGWSLKILLEELPILYHLQQTQQTITLAPPRHSYADYIRWQQELLTSAQGEALWQYWQQKLAGELPVLQLPFDHPRPPVLTYRGDSCSFQLTPALTQQLKDLARQEKVSLHTLLLSIYLIFLHRYTQQSDVIVGSPTLGRRGSEFQTIVGHFVNMVPIRSLISEPISFLDFLQQTRQTVLESLDHQDFPLAVLVERLQPQRDASYSPIFQTSFELEQFERSPEADPTPVEWGGLRLIPQPLRLFEGQFDLDLEMLDSDSGLLGIFKYNTDLFNRTTIERMQLHFQTLLQGILSHPQSRIQTLPLLTKAEQAQLQQWQATGQVFPQDLCIHQLFEAQVQRTPEAIALVAGQEALSYRELDRRANQLAHYLQTLGIGPEIRVGLGVERGLEMVIGILGILKAGGAYVPMDPSYPPERLQFMLQDAEASVLLTQASLLPLLKIPSSCRVICLDRDAALLHSLPTDPCPVQLSPHHLAYIIYTSGSTGQPKGVMIPHANLVNAYFAWDEIYHLSSQIHSHLQMASFAFDVFTGDWVRALCSGGKLVICPREYLLDPHHLYTLMRREQVDCAEFVPAVVRALMDYLQDTGQDLRQMQVLIVGSDSWTLAEMDRLRPFCSPQTRIVSSYGVTEATIDSSYFETTDLLLSRPQPVPIGRPFANTQLWILDPALNPVPIGVVGELYIAGAGVARGYWNRPDLTRARFVTIALHDGEPVRCYQTGDLARYLSDGTIELIGRVDHQVKIRGYRVELGDIESVLNQQDQVQQAVVVAEETVAGNKRLLAYVQGQELDPTALKTYLKQQLPDYMVPAIIIPLAAFPLTPNGKVDRKALPTPEPDLPSQAAPPRTELEQTLVTLWQQILGREAIGINENFFALGGDSILSIQVIARARQRGIQLSPRQLFQYQTIAELAATLEHQPRSPISAQQDRVIGAVPLTPIQRWFLDQDWPNPHHFNQAVLLQVPPDLQVEALLSSLNRVIEHHDALRLQFVDQLEGWQQFHTQESVTADLKLMDLQDLTPAEQSSTLATLAAQHQTHMHLSTGPLLQAVLFQLGSDQPDRLLLILHHLVVDAVSWRILLTDLFDCYQQVSQGQDPKLPPKTTAFQDWALRLQSYSHTEELQDQRHYWLKLPWSQVQSLPLDHKEETPSLSQATYADAATISVSLNPTATQQLLQIVPRRYNTQINDALLTALALVIGTWSGHTPVLVELEGHGREDLFSEVDLSRTVGWLTSLYPVLLPLPDHPSIGAVLPAVKDYLRRIPQAGIGFGLLRHLAENTEIRSLPTPQIGFNYLGQLDQGLDFTHAWSWASESCGAVNSPTGTLPYLLEINAQVIGGCLQVDWTYSRRHHQAETVSRLAQQYLQTLQEIIDHCQASGIRGFTPSDFPLVQLTQAELDQLVQSLDPQQTIASIYPLTPMQQGMLFHSRFAPAEGFYVEQLQLTLQGSVDWDAFQEAWQQLTHHHAVLRTCFVETQDQLVQVVLDQVEIPWTMLDWRHLAAEAQQTQLQAWLHQDRQQGFVERQAPLARCCRMHLEQDRYHFVWTYHHALLDGWSMPLLLRDLLACYGTSSQPQINPVHPRGSFENYIVWLQQQDQAEAKVYWQKRLAGFTAPIQLPVQNRLSDPLRAAEATYHQHILEFPQELKQSLQAWLQDQHLTLAPLIYGTWGLLLSRYCRESDVVFGVTISGRAVPLSGIEEVVGLCINTLPLRINLADQLATTQLLQTIQQDLQDLQQQGFLSLAEIQHLSLIPGGQSLFETLVVIENYPLDQALQQQSLLPIERITVREHTHYPLTLVALPGESLSFCFSYNSQLFMEADITRMAAHFQNLLQAMISSPHQPLITLPLLSSTEQHQLLWAWNDTAATYPTDLCIHQWVEIQAQKTPDAVAVVYEQIQLSYGELNAQANRLAHHLQTLGVGPEVLVGLCVERSIEMIIALLAILKAGGAYVPLDPTYPLERLRLILQDTQLSILISQHPLQDRIPPTAKQQICWIDDAQIWANASPENLIPSPCPENVAYVIYTSGSTGQPKGVLVQHRGLVNLVQAQIETFGVSPESRVLQFASLNFDASISEIGMALCSGARLCLASPEALLPGNPLLQTLETQAITHVTLPPSVLAVLPVQDLPDLCTLIVAGEACSADLVAKWGKRRRFFNAYGPTEATVCTTIAVDPQGPPPIGRPIANTQVYILDPHLNPVPVGVPGELHIGGIGLARGYLNRPELTQQKFIPNPFSEFPESRLYKTGDLARYCRDGTIEFLGRIDDQVKIRGYRIEPGEIANLLAQHPDVREAVVLAREDHPGQKRLVAYIVPELESSSGGSEQDPLTELWPSVAEYYVYDEMLYFAMTHDQRRNHSYRIAIDQQVKDKVVVDIGTGKDAILARFCAEAGARKVYAIERDLETSHLAAACVHEYGFSDQITVIHGDARVVDLPEPVDVCVSEIVGPIGGCEGAAVILNQARRFLTPEGLMIPERSTTKIAAVSLPEELLLNPHFTPTSRYYTDKIFAQIGYAFDLRLCIKRFPHSHILSTAGVFEDLDFRQQVESEAIHESILTIEKTGNINGFLIWLNLQTIAGEVINILEQEYCWLPVYFPVFDQGVEVTPGDRIQIRCERRLSDNQLNPDYFIQGEIIRNNEDVISFDYSSYHHQPGFKQTSFYQKLFRNEEIQNPSYLHLSTQSLKDYLRRHLPEYMVPGVIISLEQMPLTPSGKVDRHALPAPEEVLDQTPTLHAPQTQTQRQIAELFAEVLALPADRISLRDSFFELGGHSLLATQLVSRFRQTFGVDIPLQMLFAAPTVVALEAKLLEISPRDQVTIGSTPRDGSPLPLSYAQERLWVLSQLEQGSSATYNIFGAMQIEGDLKIPVLQAALDEVIRRHEMLRTSFPQVNGLAGQQIHAPTNLPITILDEQDLPISLQDWLVAEAQQPFDLEQWPLMRVTLIQQQAQPATILVVTLHHMISDGWSMGVLIREVATLYRAYRQDQPSPLAPLPIQYGDFTLWQRQWLQGAVLDQQRDYWLQQLADAPPHLHLPTDHPRPAVQTFRGRTQTFTLNSDLRDALQHLCQTAGVTPFMALLSVYALLLSTYCRQHDLLIGSPIANRTRVELEPLIGFFVNTLVLRIQLQDGLTFRQLLNQVREVCLQAFQHQDLPFEQLVRHLNLERDLSLPPLVQAAFALENDPLPLLELPDLTMTPLEVDPQIAKTDLTLYIHPGSDGYVGAIEYNTDLFADTTITRLIAHFQQLLKTAVSKPDQAITSLYQGIRPPLSRHTPFGATQLALNHTLHQTNLSANQLLIWLGQQLDLQSPVYNNAACSLISGTVDPDLFREAFQDLIVTADALRTVIEVNDGIPQQRVLPKLKAELEYWDASTFLEDVDLEAYLEQSARQPFDLSQPLWKSTLIQLAPDQFLWFTRTHQIIADGISVQLILETVDQLYSQRLRRETHAAIHLEPLQSFLQDEQTYRHSSRHEKDQAFWDREFSFPVQPLSFYGRSSRKQTQTVNRISYTLAPQICLRLHEIVTKEGEEVDFSISLPHFLLTVFLIYLHKISGSEEMCIGIPFHNRLTEKHQRTVGALMQVVPLRISVLPRDNIASLFERIKRKSLQILYHGQYTIRNSQPSPTYDILFNYHVSQSQSFQNWKVESKWIHSGCGYESLALQIHDFADSGQITLDFDFHCDVFPESLRPVALDHFLKVLDLCLNDLEQSITQITLLTETERDQILLKWQGSQQQSSPQCIHKLFEVQVQQTPDAIAVIRDQESLNYRDLNARANQLAHHLQSLGVGPEILVGLCVERSLEMIVGLLGILKAGGAYVPLDPTYPPERLQFMIEDAQMTILLTQSSVRERIQWENLPQLHVVDLDQDWSSISIHPPTNPEKPIHPNHLAYVIYTSGSTGKPKGVMVEHQALTTFTQSAIAEYQITASDRVLQFASLSFDAAVEEIFICLSTGATLILRTEEMLQPAILMQQCLEWQITVLDLPTAFWTQFSAWLVNHRIPPQHLRLVIIGGEKVPWDAVQLWLKHFGASPRLINSYGPTETTIVATTCLLTPQSCLEAEGREIPIGRPLPHVQVYILDPDLQPVPIGMPGELYIGGTGLARGYWQRPDLTAQSFIANPYSQGRLYKTGDLARSRADGMIEYLGRSDQQVKIRGFRVELGEIEAVLHRHEQVQQAAVILHGEHTENPQLVAYVVVHPHSDPDLHTLNLALQQQLPGYMIPHLLHLDALPLTTNGKINREALPLPSPGILTSQPHIPPRNSLELQLLQIWSELFPQARISVLDQFFELGGHSLLAIRLTSRIAETFGRPLPLSTLFQNSTIEKLAIWLNQEKQPLPESVLVPLQPQGHRVPLFCIHPAGGNALCYTALLPHLNADQPVYGLQSQGLLTGQQPLDHLAAMARDYRDAIRTIQPQGPYQILGWSMGGVIAYDIAQQLQQLGESVKNLILIDSFNPAGLSFPEEFSLSQVLVEIASLSDPPLPVTTSDLAPLDPEEQMGYVLQLAKDHHALPVDMTLPQFADQVEQFQSDHRAFAQYIPTPYTGPVLLLTSTESLSISPDPTLGWGSLIAKLQTHTISGTHLSLMRDPAQVCEVAHALQQFLSQPHPSAGSISPLPL